MRMMILRVATTGILSVALATMAIGVASAKGPGGGGGPPHGFSQGMKSGWNGAHVPPGWSKGKKVGWGNSRTSPPGWR